MDEIKTNEFICELGLCDDSAPGWYMRRNKDQMLVSLRCICKKGNIADKNYRQWNESLRELYPYNWWGEIDG